MVRDRTVNIVVFDLGGVLVDVTDSWAEAFRRVDIAVEPVLDDVMFLQERERLWNEFQVGETPAKYFFEELSRASDGTYSPNQFVKGFRARLLGEYSGASEVVELVEASGVKTGALSNTNPVHWHEIRESRDPGRYPTVKRLDNAHTSHRLGHAKPDPRIYRAFEEQVEEFGPSILFFDNRPENVETARALGWNAERIDPDDSPSEQLEGYLDEYDVV
jgi:HAD superfamily hydrolase (TIGR01509 family)